MAMKDKLILFKDNSPIDVLEWRMIRQEMTHSIRLKSAHSLTKYANDCLKNINSN